MMIQVKSLMASVPYRYWIGPLVILFLIAGLPLLVWWLGVIGQDMQNQYQEARLQNTQWQRYLNLLSQAPMQELALSSDRTALEVSLREAAQMLQQLPEVQIDAFIVQAGEAIGVDDDLDSLLEPIRIGFEATLIHAPALLDIINQLTLEAGWRVTEVRGCAMQRLVSEPRLATACTIDIYHWSWTTTNDMEIES